MSKKEDNPKVMDMLKAVLKTPSFLIMIVAFCLANFGTGIATGDMLYYLTYKLEKPEMMATLLPCIYIGSFAGSLLAGYFFRFGKIRMIKIGYLCTIGAYALRMATGDSSITPFIGYMLYAFGSGLVGTYMVPCLADCADYAEYKTGIRCQALTLTGYTLVNKMAGGLGIAVMGFALQFAGYNGTSATQTEEAVKMMHTLQFYPVFIFCAITIILISFYKLDEKTMETIRMAKTGVDTD